ncbi:hypothetical protein SEA_BUSEPHILIS_46 [Microbacterium phage Busephilis]|nr:hypothetical protein SEA_BUSEPHILIS_46 [Microbacterium phage Busephilis]
MYKPNRPEGLSMHPDTEPLPADLAKPRRDRASTSALAGIITGGVMLAICIGGMIFYFTL